MARKPIADISGYTPKQLEELISKAEVRKKEMRREAAAALKEKALKLIRDEGFTFDDIFPRWSRTNHRQPGVRPTAPPKYANPDNPSQKWNGIGKRPQWFREAIEAGVKRESLEIKLTT